MYPLIRNGLHFISGKPIANSHSGRRQRGLGGGNLWVPNKRETPIWYAIGQSRVRHGLALNGKIIKISNKTQQKIAKSSPKPSKIMRLVVLGCSNGDLGRLGAVLAHLGVILGSSWDDLDHNFRSAWRQDGNKMDPSWCQDAPSWHLNGHLDAIWGAILLILGVSGPIFTKIEKI